VIFSESLPLRAGVVTQDERLIALNRPAGEDQPQVVSEAALTELFAGLDFRVLTDSLDEGRSLTSEVWRTFLILMGIALIGEALLCMPAGVKRLRPRSRPRPPTRTRPRKPLLEMNTWKSDRPIRGRVE
jgi:hypothetical protein